MVRSARVQATPPPALKSVAQCAAEPWWVSRDPPAELWINMQLYEGIIFLRAACQRQDYCITAGNMDLPHRVSPFTYISALGKSSRVSIPPGFFAFGFPLSSQLPCPCFVLTFNTLQFFLHFSSIMRLFFSSFTHQTPDVLVPRKWRVSSLLNSHLNLTPPL